MNRRRGASPWKVVVVADEAARNVRDGGGRTLLLLVAVVVGIVGASWWDAASIDGARADERRLVRRGTTTMVVTPPEGVVDGLDPRRCAALDRRVGVRAAGPVWDRAPLRTVATGSRRISAVVATDGAVAALTGEARPEPGVRTIVSAPLADDLALRPGATLRVEGDARSTTLPVGAVTELGRRRLDLDAAVALVGWRAIGATECWVELEPWVPEDVALSVVSAFATERSPRVAYVMPPDDLLRSPGEQVRTRPSRGAGAVAGALVAIVWAALLWGRRDEVGLYRSFRVGRARVASLVWCELVLVVGAGSLVAAAAGFGVAAVVGVETVAWAVLQGAVTVGAALAVGAVVALVVARAPTVDLLKR